VAFGKRCGEAGVRPSMGSVGDAYDNAMAESFFSTLEAELLSRRPHGAAWSSFTSCVISSGRNFEGKALDEILVREH
jgi:transposase InsO family protein